MRNRMRSTIKWAGTVLTVLLLVVWVGSAWWGWQSAMPRDFGVALVGEKILLNWSETESETRRTDFWSGPDSRW